VLRRLAPALDRGRTRLTRLRALPTRLRTLPTRLRSAEGPLVPDGRLAWTLGLLLAGLLPAVPLVHLYAARRGELTDPGFVLASAAVAAAALIVAAALIARHRSHNPLRVGAGVGVVGLLFFASNLLSDDLAIRIAFFTVAAPFAARGAAAVLHRREPAVVAIAACLVYVGVATIGQLGSPTSSQSSDAAPVVAANTSAKPPNVYYFVLGAHAREDVAQRLDPADDPSGFDRALRSLGFAIDPIATANYLQDDQSVASTLEQRLIIQERSAPETVSADLNDTLRGENQTVDWFRAQRYRYVQTSLPQLPGGSCDRDRADGCLALFDALDAVLNLTPLGPVLGGSEPSSTAQFTPNDVVDALVEDDVIDDDRPTFVMAHIVSPHPPYIRDADCASIGAVGSLGEGWAERHKRYYMAQLRCARTQLRRAMRRLVALDPTAIIVLQSDTGPAFDLAFGAPADRLTEQMVRTRYGAFRAWRLPPRCRTTDERASSLVNTFAVVQACIAGKPPQMVNAQAFVNWFDSTRVERLPSGIAYPSSR